jgi:tRNA-Thr(GGU) m(6)t(6)A37 methyltransferase TsaA
VAAVTAVTAVELQPIGHISSSRSEAIDDDWDAVSATVTLDADRFGADALRGLDEFSHVEIVYLFHQVDPGDIRTGARHPRGNPEWPAVGIFAQRAKMRPNRIGTTVCRLLDVDGLTLSVAGLDAVDGTPLLDVKPYMAEFGPRGEVRQPVWSRELMATYWTR